MAGKLESRREDLIYDKMDVGGKRTLSMCARTQRKVRFNFPQEHHMCYCVTPAHPDFQPEVILSWVSPVVTFEMGSGLKFNGWNMGYFGSNLGHFSD
jgi:hypothetical protein